MLCLLPDRKEAASGNPPAQTPAMVKEADSSFMLIFDHSKMPTGPTRIAASAQVRVGPRA
jgi:hypothetical protein